MSDFASSVTKTYPEAADAALTLTDVSATAKTLIRAEITAAAAQDLGVAFGASQVVDGTLVAATRPTAWVVLGPEAQVAAYAATVSDAGHVSKVDFTHGRALFRITGADSSKVLEKVCSIDWTDNMMPDGAVVSASLAKVTCDIIRNDVSGTRSYFIMSDRSSGQYLFDAILDAGDEFNMGVAH